MDGVARERSLLSRLPNEIRDCVFEQVEFCGFPFGVEEAERVAKQMRWESWRLANRHQYPFSVMGPPFFEE